MSKPFTVRKFVSALALLALALAGWYLGRPDVSVAPVHAPVHTPVEKAAHEESSPLSLPSAESPRVPPAQAAVVKSGGLPAPDGLPLWERKIDEALRSNAEPPAIAQLLLQQVPSMPGEGQAASARHIANLIPDKDYLTVLPYVQNTRLDPGFQEVMVAESLNRADSVKLPVLLAAARTPQHPMAEIAKSTLVFLLDADHGTDWAKWEAAVRQSLQKTQQ
jgi:hypothetical protein